MSPFTMDSIVPSAIFSTTAIGIFMFATASDVQTAVIGICSLILAFIFCYYEFIRLANLTPRSKIE